MREEKTTELGGQELGEQDHQREGVEPVQGSACASDSTGQGSSDKDAQNQAPVPVPGARGGPEGKDRARERGAAL